MQELYGPRPSAGMKWLQPLMASRNAVIVSLVIIGSTALICAGSASLVWPTASVARITVATNGATLWGGDTKITAPGFDFSLPDTQTLSVSPLFERYYISHRGDESLGNPVTAAFPTKHGWIQFFESDALLLPAVHVGALIHYALNGSDPLVGLIRSGARDSGTGIIRLPLLQALLSAGSKVPIGGDGSIFTYVDLRKATNPDLMLSAPAADLAALSSPATNGEVFIKGGTHAGKDVGHMVPQAFWSYINRPAVSPDGWKTDFGAPLTEALSYTITEHTSVHHLLVQAFWRGGLALDENTLDASGQFQVQRLATSMDYLRTVGPPPVVTSAQQTIGAQEDTALFSAPSIGHTVAHVGPHFPLTLLGDTTWNSGMLWYHVQWTASKRTASGWVSAAAIAFTSPGNLPGWASLDALSPNLGAYLTDIGANVGAVVYDVTRQRYYTYNANAQFLTGSSIKVPILLTFLDMIEQQHRLPRHYEMNLLTTMIEDSNNDSAGMLYHTEVGDAAGVAAYMQKIGISGLKPYPIDFGWSEITPLAMVNLLTYLYTGSILTAQDRNLALSLMERIEPDQRAGVGDTAPEGGTVAMKDGWVRGPDNQWAMNSSGIVTVDQETYIISVYTQEQASLSDGQAIARHVCSTITALLT